MGVGTRFRFGIGGVMSLLVQELRHIALNPNLSGQCMFTTMWSGGGNPEHRLMELAYWFIMLGFAIAQPNLLYLFSLPIMVDDRIT